METAYQAYLRHKEFEYEEQCRRCGKCCGADNDPCENLTRLCNGSYFCLNYRDRIGLHKTAHGREFNCVPIKDLLRKNALPANCAYRNYSTNGIYL